MLNTKSIKYSFLLGVILLFLFFFLTSFERAKGEISATLSIDPSSGSYNVGDTFSVAVKLNTGGNETDGVDIHYLHYNPSLLEVQEITPGTLYANTNTNNVDSQNGTIDFSQTSQGGSTFNGEGTVMTITFKVLSAGTATLTFDFVLSSTTDTNVASQGEDVLQSVSGATFTLVSVTPQTCSDGTPYGECSQTKPKYCQEGNLIDKCSICGCPSGFACQEDETCQEVDTTPPQRSSGYPSGELSSGTTEVTMSLTTDESATCKYDTSPNIDFQSMANTFSNTGALVHSTTITGLSDGTSYTFYIKCQDTSGNANQDDYVISFSVASPPSSGGGGGGGGWAPPPPADTTPPVISDIDVTNITTTSVTIIWKTNESATSKIHYGLTGSYELGSISKSGYRTSHSIELSNLKPSTTYYFKIETQDSNGNIAYSSQQSFKTLGIEESSKEGTEAQESETGLTPEAGEVTTSTQEMTKEEMIAYLKAQIQAILKQIAILQAKLAELLAQQQKYTFTKNLKYGDRGEDVKHLQEILIKEGCLRKGLATGWFGPLTFKAVICFQEKYASEILYPAGLKKGTGFVGPRTRAKLNQL